MIKYIPDTESLSIDITPEKLFKMGANMSAFTMDEWIQWTHKMAEAVEYPEISHALISLLSIDALCFLPPKDLKNVLLQLQRDMHKKTEHLIEVNQRMRDQPFK